MDAEKRKRIKELEAKRDGVRKLVGRIAKKAGINKTSTIAGFVSFASLLGLGTKKAHSQTQDKTVANSELRAGAVKPNVANYKLNEYLKTFDREKEISSMVFDYTKGDEFSFNKLDANTKKELAQAFGHLVDHNALYDKTAKINIVYDDDYKSGSFLYAAVFFQDKKVEVYKFTDENGQTSYRTPNGDNVKDLINPMPLEEGKGIISSSFNPKRWHPKLKKYRAHKGIDITAPRTTQILAAADGVVSDIGFESKGYGNYIKIQHANGYETVYAHMNKRTPLKVGQAVEANTPIGEVGNTGLSVAPHLHFEIRKDGKAVNPLQETFIAKPKPGRNIMQENLAEGYSIGEKLTDSDLAAFETQKQMLREEYAYAFEHEEMFQLASNPKDLENKIRSDLKGKTDIEALDYLYRDRADKSPNKETIHDRNHDHMIGQNTNTYDATNIFLSGRHRG